jgi:hypothetical protein
MHSFNLAMLAKQVWRLLSEPNSPCARILKEKYYLDGRLLRAKTKVGSSFTWQSVLAGLECFKKGKIWRVGDGTQINIWSDNWIQGSRDLKIQTPRARSLVTAINELINPIDGSWDEDLLRTLFSLTDIQNILQIPLSPGREDLVAWHYNWLGMFSVRSAYHCQWTSQFEDDASAGNENVWERLWKLSIQGKIKIYGWRVLNGFVPCRGILLTRHIGDNADCPMCPSRPEGLKHMMFMCDQAKSVWNYLGVWRHIEELANGDRTGQQMIEKVIKGGRKVPSLNNVGLVELILTGSWYIWWEWRGFVHEESVQNASRSAMSIAALPCNYMRA